MSRVFRAELDEVRAFHAKAMAAAGNAGDERIERIFELVPRDAFLGPGPWQIMVNGRYLETPSADPIYVYQNVLVALDAAKGISNGELFLHAEWIAAADPRPGDIVVHVGAGTGYYTALLSMLVLPSGHVHAFEIDEALARRARENLEPFESIVVTMGDATALPLPAADLIYVNAAIVAPPIAWLKALKAGGRMIFPWQPSSGFGLTLLLTRAADGLSIRPLMNSRFIACTGASDAQTCAPALTMSEARSIRSAWLTEDRAPDETAVAIFPALWFSATALASSS